MNKKSLYKYQELPLSRIQEDSNQPRQGFGTKGDKNRLKKSIQEHGILQPIEVSQSEDDVYTIIDGHRRYNVAKELKFAEVPCIVYSRLKPAELEIRRFELQNNRRPWKPIERSNSLERIKSLMHFKSNRQLADLIGVSKTLVNNTFQLRALAFDHVAQMERYGLTGSYQMEFVRLRPKIRRVGNFEIQEIIDNIFQRVQNNVIKNAKDFRTLGNIFSRASANEAALISFLSDPDMTIDELEQRSSRSSLTLSVEMVIKQMSDIRQKGIEFSPQEKEVIKLLIKLAKEIL